MAYLGVTELPSSACGSSETVSSVVVPKFLVRYLIKSLGVVSFRHIVKVSLSVGAIHNRRRTWC